MLPKQTHINKHTNVNHIETRQNNNRSAYYSNKTHFYNRKTMYMLDINTHRTNNIHLCIIYKFCF